MIDDSEAVLRRLDELQEELATQDRVNQQRYDQLQSHFDSLRDDGGVEVRSASFPITHGPVDEYYHDTNGQSGYHFIAGVEATYMHVNDSALSRGGPGFDLKYGWQAAPRIWTGFENVNGWGMRVRYWQFGDVTEPADSIVTLNPMETAFVHLESRLDTYAVDWELTRRMQLGNWSFLGSIGARNAGLGSRASTSVARISDPPEDSFAFQLSSTRRFDGTGATFALEGKRPVGSTPFAFIWNLRGSVLAGKSSISAREVADSTDDPQMTGTLVGGTRSALWTGEAQVGVEWSQPLSYGNGLVFVRAMYETQTWFVPGFTGTANNFAGTNGPLAVGDNTFVFNGLTASAGFVW